VLTLIGCFVFKELFLTLFIDRRLLRRVRNQARSELCTINHTLSNNLDKFVVIGIRIRKNTTLPYSKNTSRTEKSRVFLPHFLQKVGLGIKNLRMQ